MVTNDGEEFREILSAAIEKRLAREPVALLFSGGTDSLTVLWALRDLGAKITCYTFRLAGTESADWTTSQRVCDCLGVERVGVVADEAAAGADVEAVIRIIRSARKTHVEVMYAYRLLLMSVRERQVWSGIQADTLYGSNKSAAIRAGKLDAAGFKAYRETLLANPGQEGLAQAIRAAEHFGKELAAPYSSDEVRNWFMLWSWADLNRPKQKMPAVLGFAAEYAALQVYRRDDNLQCGSGIRELMARTFGGRQRAAYRRMLEAAEKVPEKLGEEETW